MVQQCRAVPGGRDGLSKRPAAAGGSSHGLTCPPATQGSHGRATATGCCEAVPGTAHLRDSHNVPPSIQPLAHANDCQHETEAVKGKKITP